MAWWDIFCNSASIPGDKQEEDVPEEYIEIFGPKPAISPGAKPNIYVTGAANRWEKRAKNFKGIILDFDFDALLKQILNSLPLQGVETKERWMQISDPRNYDILEPVLYEMNDGHEFLAFLDTPNNVSLNRVSLRAFKNSPSSKIVYFQRKLIRLGFFVPNIHPGFITPRALEANEALDPNK